jgi:ribonuclease P protein component
MVQSKNKLGKLGRFVKQYVTLTQNREFQFLFKKGVSVGTYAFVCYVLQTKRRVNRLGIITSKKIGNSVKRSRARRVVREAFRQIEPLLREKTKNHYDFVFVTRVKTTEVSSKQVYGLIKKYVYPKIFPNETQNVQKNNTDNTEFPK